MVHIWPELLQIVMGHMSWDSQKIALLVKKKPLAEHLYHLENRFAKMFGKVPFLKFLTEMGASGIEFSLKPNTQDRANQVNSKSES